MTSLLLLLACNGEKVTDTAATLTGPALAHTPPAAVATGTPVTFTVTATDPEGVGAVSFFHRREGDSAWSFEPMERGEGDDWSVALEGDELQSPALEYYFKATDAGDVVATGYLPEDPTNAPLSLTVYVEGAGLPFVEDFEFESGEATLQDLGWANAGLGFRGEGWNPTRAHANGGEWSVTHGQGGQTERSYEDWLISPAIDLSAASTVQVSWRERGTSTERANHRLMASVGGRDPEGGDWAPVPMADGGETLPAPVEGAWGRSAIYDLTAFAGQPAVYLAWVYEGVAADNWWIDDVRVEAHQPDLAVTVDTAPTPIDPGGSGVLSVNLTNLGLVDASDVAVSVTFPSGGATVDEGSVPADVPLGGSASVPFTLHVDAATLDNAWLPVQVQVALPSGTETYDTRMLVGLPSTAHVSFTPESTAFVTLTLGVGDPAAPTWSQVLYEDLASAIELDVDITEQRAYLPATPGDGRWFLTVESSEDGQVGDFRIAYDGSETVATIVSRVNGEEPATVLLPTPPSFEGTFAASGGDLTPGAVGATLDATLTNAGAATSGAVTAELSSTDPDVTVTDAGPVVVSASGLASGEVARLSRAFAFDVAATHTDSTEVFFDLTLTDAIESFLVPVAIDVPWPALGVAAITIDDDGGDGLLDADEHAEIEVQVSNAGDRSTSGTTRGTLALASGSAVTATISTNTESYGTIGSRASRWPYGGWDVTVAGGAEGETLDMVLSLADSTRTWALPFSLTLGEPPWQPLAGVDDAAGDVVDGGSLDLARGRWRVVDGVLQLEVESHTAFDTSRAFIESWMESPGSDWSFYRLVLQSGLVELQGYGSSGFVDLSEPAVSFPDASTVRFDITLADMGLSINSLSLGIAAGWCGPDTYYCDHYPDGWGYPYVAWSPWLFYTIDW